jgi:hypothetical protein
MQYGIKVACQNRDKDRKPTIIQGEQGFGKTYAVGTLQENDSAYTDSQALNTLSTGGVGNNGSNKGNHNE